MEYCYILLFGLMWSHWDSGSHDYWPGYKFMFTYWFLGERERASELGCHIFIGCFFIDHDHFIFWVHYLWWLIQTLWVCFWLVRLIGFNHRVCSGQWGSNWGEVKDRKTLWLKWIAPSFPDLTPSVFIFPQKIATQRNEALTVSLCTRQQCNQEEIAFQRKATTGTTNIFCSPFYCC